MKTYVEIHTKICELARDTWNLCHDLYDHMDDPLNPQPGLTLARSLLKEVSDILDSVADYLTTYITSTED